MQKAKKEDFRVEEELRTQKIKYEESNDDVYRRMLDIKDSEAESTVDLGAFLDAQLSYHEKCQEALLQLKNEWPGPYVVTSNPGSSSPLTFRRQGPAPMSTGRRTGRARSATAHSLNDRYEPLHEEPSNMPEQRSFPPSMVELPGREAFATDPSSQRPVANRVSTFEGPMQLRQEQPWQSRENHTFRRTTSHIQPVSRVASDPYADPSDEASSYNGTGPGYLQRGRSVSPATSHGSAMSRTTSASTMNGVPPKKAPPPPPPRSKKPAPPPLPMMKKPIIAGDA